MKQHYIFSVVLSILLAFAGMVRSDITEDDIYRLLTENGVAYDKAALHNGMITGMLQATDLRACLLFTNDIIRLNSLAAIASTEILGESINYIKLNGLYRNSGDKICNELDSYTNAYISGQILDLRGAGGNDLETVNFIACRYAVSNTPLYSIADSSGNIISNYNVPSNIVVNSSKPLMLLIDDKTHDASEVLTALLKEKAGVMLLGSKTKGHTGLMKIVPVSATNSLYLAAEYILPVGAEESFTNGILPDIVIKESNSDKESDLALSGKVLIGKNISAKAKVDRKLMERVAGDAVLQRATDILSALKAVE